VNLKYVEGRCIIIIIIIITRLVVRYKGNYTGVNKNKYEI